MTDKIDLLPLPEEHYVNDEGLWETRYGPYNPEQMKDYARANVKRHATMLRAEIDALRAQVNALQAEALTEKSLKAVSPPTEQLMKALQELIDWFPSGDTYRRLGFDPEAPMRALREAKALLPNKRSKP